MSNPPTAKTLADAKIFQSHRSMIAEVAALMEGGRIETYSIHSNCHGVSAGVRIGGQWAYLA